MTPVVDCSPGGALATAGHLRARQIQSRITPSIIPEQLKREIIRMDVTSLVIFLAIGAIAGWLAGVLMKGGGFGLIGNIIVGIIGAVIGGFIADLVGLSATGIIGSILLATVGAVVLLFIVSLVKKA
jgi:uncharacterized membrane protein YeaQ/YmgE (transglycosylase-associated protein family)